MVASTADNLTLAQKSPSAFLPWDVAAGSVIYINSLVAVSLTGSSAGYAVPASDSANIRLLGVANNHADNTNGANGAISVDILSPYSNPNACLTQLYMANPTKADRGSKVYVLDNQTVGLTSTNSILVGYIIGVNQTGPNGVVTVSLQRS